MAAAKKRATRSRKRQATRPRQVATERVARSRPKVRTRSKTLAEAPIDLSGMLQVLRGPKAKKYPLISVAREGDVGFDVVCVSDTLVPPGVGLKPTEIPVDMCVKLPKDTAGFYYGRSSTHNRYRAIEVVTTPIDEGYTGPIGPRVRNSGSAPILIKAGAAVAQLVLKRVVKPQVIEVDVLPVTERGDKRFGSTGR